MKLKTIINWHLFAIHLLGLSSTNPFLHTKNILMSFLHCVPQVILWSQFCIASFVVIYNNLFSFGMFRPRQDAVIGTFFLISELACILLSILQSMRFSDDLHQIVTTFQGIDIYLVKHICLKINYSSFLRRYLRNLSWMFIMYFLMTIVKVVFPSRDGMFLLEASFSFIRLYVVIGKLHAFFYINLLRLFLQFTKGLTTAETSVMPVNIQYHNQCILKLLKHYKLIHYKLYTVSTKINAAFGWSLISICMETFLENAFMFYWMIFYLDKGDSSNMLHILSKYLNNLFIKLILFIVRLGYRVSSFSYRMEVFSVQIELFNNLFFFS